VAFLSDRDKGRSVWLLPMDGGEPKRLTDRDGVVLALAWAPDGRSLAVSLRALTKREKLLRDEKRDELARLPDFRHVTRLMYKADGAGYLTGERAHIWLVKVRGGKPLRLTRGDYDNVEPGFSPDGRRVSFLSNRGDDPDRFPENLDVHTVRPDGRGLRKVTREPGPAFGHVWAPDGSSIYYLGHTGGPGEWSRHNIHPRRVAAGGGASKDLTPDLDANAMNMVIGDVAGTDFGGPAPVLTADGARLLFCATREGACHLGSVPTAGGEVGWGLLGSLTVFGFGLPRSGGAGWVLLGDLTSPGDLHRLEPGDTAAPPKRITKLNDRVLAGLDIVEPEEIRVRRKGGEIHGWVLRPPRFRAGRKYPLVLEIHGGPHVGYGHVFFHEAQLLAAAGYVVLMTNPRGSDGYGMEHRNAIHADWGNLDEKDILRALDAVMGEGYVDPERVFVTGGSYGGYMTNWLLGRTKRFRAAVTQRSVVNLATLFGTSDIGYYFGYEFDGSPWEAEERYRRLSPITNAKKIETPLLIVHSEEDYRCSIGEAEQLYTTLKLLGREVEMVRFVGESHGLSRGGRPQNRAERLRRILGWFRSHGGAR